MLGWLGYWFSPQQASKSCNITDTTRHFPLRQTSFLVFPLLWTLDAVDVAQQDIAGVVTVLRVQQFSYHLLLKVLGLSLMWSKGEYM